MGFKKTLKKAFHFIFFVLDDARLDRAIRIAETQHAKDGQRYYVIQGEGKNLVIINRYMMRKLRSKGAMNKNVRVINLRQECFYCTEDRSGRRLHEKILKLKRKQYHEICDIM